MANELDEMNSTVNEKGRDIHVIEKQVSPKHTAGDTVFQVFMWFPLLIPGIIFWFIKKNAQSYLSGLQQKVNTAASQVDNYLEQRVQILKNTAKLLDKAIKLDKDTFTEIAKLRSGKADINTQAKAVEEVNKKINVALENYPDIKAHQELQDAMQQNAYLQKEITAARDNYNDVVNEWNHAIFIWPSKKIVAVKNGYTTRIPFSIDMETRKQARETFF